MGVGVKRQNAFEVDAEERHPQLANTAPNLAFPVWCSWPFSQQRLRTAVLSLFFFFSSLFLFFFLLFLVLPTPPKKVTWCSDEVAGDMAQNLVFSMLSTPNTLINLVPKSLNTYI